jgi:exonuclease SbcC
VRPLRIEIEGFSGFRDRVVVDLDGVELFALVGPTGAGKSSVLDALVFALYGTIPRLDDRRAVGPVINLQCNEARVRLDFRLGDRSYSAVRVLRRNPKEPTKATTREARLEVRHGTDPDGESEVLAGKERDLNDTVVELLGLDFDQFTKTVLLPQGQFMAFLHDDGRRRQDLLRQLFGLDVYVAVGQRARRRADELAVELRRTEAELAALAELSDDGLRSLRQRAQALDELAIAAAREADLLDADRRRVQTLEEQLQQRRVELAALQATAVPSELAGHDDAARALDDRRRRAADALVAARGALDDARAERDALGSAVEIERLLQRRHELAELEVSLDDVARRRLEAASAATAAVVAADERTAAHDALADVLRHLRRGADVTALRAALASGEPCPVCDRPVVDVPPAPDDRELQRLEADERGAATAASDARRAAERARSRAEAAAEAEAEARQRLARLASALADAPAVDDLERRRGQLARAEAAARAAEAAVQAAEHEVAGATRAVEAQRKAELALRRRFSAARDAVASRRPPEPGHEDLAADWAALVAWARAEATTVAIEADDADTCRRDVQHALERRVRQLRADVDALGVAIGAGPFEGAGVVEAVGRAAATAHAGADGYATRLAARESLAASVAVAAEARAVASELGRLLDASNFERWLLEEVMHELVEVATEHLRTLSGGQYSLVYEPEANRFAVCDHRNADEVRLARTLSGGETFLVSLALALALSDCLAAQRVGRGAPLESLFLDEGFGTLDPDTLDVAAAALEELGSRGRVVGVITHIDDLAARMPVRFRVERTPATVTVTRDER